MNLNKKGFTLIELLAVIVLLLAISTIAIASISSAIERSKKKQDDAKIEVIMSYAELYYEEHKNSISSGSCITLNMLKLSDNEKVDSNGDPLNGVKVNISGSNVTFKYGNGC